AAVNLVIGGVSIWMSKRLAVRPARSNPAPLEKEFAGKTSRAALMRLYLAAALTGCGALLLEMTRNRPMSLVLGGSTYALSATLFVVLVGIAAGSLMFHFWLRPFASRPWLPVVVIGVLVLATLAGKWSLPWLSVAVSSDGVRHLRGEQLWNAAIS